MTRLSREAAQEYSHGRKPTDNDPLDFPEPRTGAERGLLAAVGVAPSGLSLSSGIDFRGLTPTATDCRRFAAGALVILCMMGSAFISEAFAQDSDSKPPPKDSLDQQLLDDLDRDLLKDIPGTAKPAPAADDPQAGPAIQSDNPLAALAERMRAVEARIANKDTSPETQKLQKQILAELAALMEQAKKQGGGSKKPGDGQGQGSDQPGEGSGNPTAGPVRDSTNRIEQGTKEATETADVRDLLRRMWGHLPDKMRDQMQASLSEQFLPKYERLIEEYYKRLAEERPGGP